MRNPSGVQELQHDRASGVMNRIGHPTPGPHLRFRVDAGGIGITAPLARDIGGFRDDQSGRRALAVILGSERRLHAIEVGTRPRQRRHCDTVRDMDSTERTGRKKVGGLHGQGLEK